MVTATSTIGSTVSPIWGIGSLFGLIGLNVGTNLGTTGRHCCCCCCCCCLSFSLTHSSSSPLPFLLAALKGSKQEAKTLSEGAKKLLLPPASTSSSFASQSAILHGEQELQQLFGTSVRLAVSKRHQVTLQGSQNRPGRPALQSPASQPRRR